jgi:hypothetical protein
MSRGGHLDHHARLHYAQGAIGLEDSWGELRGRRPAQPARKGADRPSARLGVIRDKLVKGLDHREQPGRISNHFADWHLVAQREQIHQCGCSVGTQLVRKLMMSVCGRLSQSNATDMAPYRDAAWLTKRQWASPTRARTA